MKILCALHKGFDNFDNDQCRLVFKLLHNNFWCSTSLHTTLSNWVLPLSPAASVLKSPNFPPRFWNTFFIETMFHMCLLASLPRVVIFPPNAEGETNSQASVTRYDTRVYNQQNTKHTWTHTQHTTQDRLLLPSPPVAWWCPLSSRKHTPCPQLLAPQLLMSCVMGHYIGYTLYAFIFLVLGAEMRPYKIEIGTGLQP